MHLSIGPLTFTAVSATAGAGTPVLTPVAVGVVPTAPPSAVFAAYSPILEFERVEGQISATTSGGGSPTLDVKLQGSFDGSIWFDIAAFTQLTAAGNNRIWILRDVPTTGVPFGYIQRLTATAGSASGVSTWPVTAYLHYVGAGAGA